MFSRKNNKINRSSRSQTTSVPMFELLESREMFSTAALPVSTAHVSSTSSALTMNVAGTKSSDSIYLAQSGNAVTVYFDALSETYVGSFASITVHSNGGSDTIVVEKSVTDKVTLYGDNGNDLLVTGASNDTLIAGSGRVNMIALGGKNNSLVCGKGYDNVWATAGNSYTNGTGGLAMHSIGGFINTSDLSLDGKTFNEPATNTQTQDTAGWANVNAFGLPLFSSAGPQLDDIQQGEIGTCYFISSLGEIAMQNQQHIRNLITPLGDGSYAEQFVNVNNGKTYFVRVDGYVPVSEAALEQGELKPEYEQPGVGDSTWAMLMEKGWAYFRAFENDKSASYGFAEDGTGEEAALLPWAVQPAVQYAQNVKQRFRRWPGHVELDQLAAQSEEGR